MTRNRMGICTAALALAALACGGNGDTQRAANEDAQVASAGNAAAVAPADTMVVYKTPTCGCCTKWVDHVAENGFAVVTHDVTDASLAGTKQELGVPAGHVSCHTATVRGYTIEGHVPADLIRRLIAERPAGIRGLAVPGMPAGSPGMESIYKQKYDVLSFDEQGRVAVYATR